MLDEPTNHLDMESVDSLLAAIDAFKGAVVLVTHSEMILSAIASRLIVFDEGKVTLFEGTYQDFLDRGGWKDEAVWVRGIADLLIVDDDNLTAWVVDYKTGNNRYPDREQLKLMALMVFAHFPHIRKVNAALLFVVKNDLVKYNMTVDEADQAWWDYRERVARIEQAVDTGVWNPRQSPLCPWCPVTSCENHPRH